jgi:hypothetical protein
MRFTIEKENSIRIAGKSLTIQPTHEGFVITEAVTPVQDSLPGMPGAAAPVRVRRTKAQIAADAAAAPAEVAAV